MGSVLKWRVDCNWGQYWEPIAAFNNEQVAINYARRCAEARSNNKLSYRVVGPRNKIIWTQNVEVTGS